MYLREISNVRQVPGEDKRRWFTSDAMDLIVWCSQDGSPSGFQFCYEKGASEFAVSWLPEPGFSHVGVDDGEQGGAMHYKLAPILVGQSEMENDFVRSLFSHAARDLPPNIREFVLARIDEQMPDMSTED